MKKKNPCKTEIIDVFSLGSKKTSNGGQSCLSFTFLGEGQIGHYG